MTPPEPETIDLISVPSDYHCLKEVFSKDQALSLSSHQPYDCAIDLQPAAPLPTSQLYNLSQPKHQAMEKYINYSLASGLIPPLYSPMGAGFFFVEKKTSHSTLALTLEDSPPALLKTSTHFHSLTLLLAP